MEQICLVGQPAGRGFLVETVHMQLRLTIMLYGSLPFKEDRLLRLTLNDEYKITSFGRIDPGNLVKQSASVYLFINPFTLDPTNQNRMFCAGGNHLYFHPNVSQIPGGSQKS